VKFVAYTMYTSLHVSFTSRRQSKISLNSSCRFIYSLYLYINVTNTEPNGEQTGLSLTKLNQTQFGKAIHKILKTTRLSHPQGLTHLEQRCCPSSLYSVCICYITDELKVIYLVKCYSMGL
jgi:hypothetical protein